MKKIWSIVIFFFVNFSGIFAQQYSEIENFPFSYEPKPEFSVSKPKTFYVKLRDGIRLAVDVYLPKEKIKGQKFPTLLYQTRYWRGVDLNFPLNSIKMVPSTSNFNVVNFVKHGYALVSVDVRGTGASEGQKTSAIAGTIEMRDGYEIMDWIVQQDWSNGKIGTLGISYIGMSAQMAMFNFHPSHKACVPMYAGFDYYEDLSYPGGVFNARLSEEWSDFCKTLDKNQLPKSKNNFFNNLVSNGVRPVKGENKNLKSLLRNRNNWYFDSVNWSIEFVDDKTTKNGKVPIDSIPSPHMLAYQKVKIPVFSYSGWFDASFTKGAMKIFRNYPSKENHLVLGPWNHGGDRCIDRKLAGSSQFPHFNVVLAFLDQHLKEKETPLAKAQKVQYYTLNQGKWKSANQFPPENVKIDTILLTRKEIHYELDTPLTNGKFTRNNIDFVKGSEFFPDRKPLDEKKLCLDLPKLEEDYVITGAPLVSLKLTTEQPDPRIFAVLEEIDSLGKVKYITEGCFRAIHRKNYSEPITYEYLPPYHSYLKTDSQPMGKGMETVEFHLEPTSYLVPKGSRIRLALSGSETDTFRFFQKDKWILWKNSKIILPKEY